jgi:hypothetical protein
MEVGPGIRTAEALSLNNPVVRLPHERSLATEDAGRAVTAGPDHGSCGCLDAPDVINAHFLKCISNRLHSLGHV